MTPLIIICSTFLFGILRLANPSSTGSPSHTPVWAERLKPQSPNSIFHNLLLEHATRCIRAFVAGPAFDVAMTHLSNLVINRFKEGAR